MPITVEIIDANADMNALEKIFAYFNFVDEKFSTYKKESEISKINNKEISANEYSKEMQEIFFLAEETKNLTDGYFDIFYNDKYDPSGIVKGWAIYDAAKILKQDGFKNFYVDAGGDVQVSGRNKEGKSWSVGIRNPFTSEKLDEKLIVKTLYIKDEGVATSGNYIRGAHIYNPKSKDDKNEISDIVSLTVVGPNIYEADRFATAAFAMGKAGIEFIERLEGFDGYMIDKDGIATMTSNFEKYTKEYA